jgi:hypothetical protein
VRRRHGEEDKKGREIEYNQPMRHLENWIKRNLIYI